MPPARVESNVTVTDASSAEITVFSDRFAYFVRVTSPHAGARFSDNYIDLRPGDTRTVHVSGLPAGFSADDLIVGSYVGAGAVLPAHG